MIRRWPKNNLVQNRKQEEPLEPSTGAFPCLKGSDSPRGRTENLPIRVSRKSSSRRVHICFLGSDLCLRAHMSILEHDKNENKYKIKTDTARAAFYPTGTQPRRSRWTAQNVEPRVTAKRPSTPNGVSGSAAMTWTGVAPGPLRSSLSMKAISASQ